MYTIQRGLGAHCGQWERVNQICKLPQCGLYSAGSLHAMVALKASA